MQLNEAALQEYSVGANLGIQSPLIAGKAKRLMNFSSARSPVLSNIPTLTKPLGLDYSLGEWRGLAKPKNLPLEITA